ncbi:MULTISPECIES: LysR family transcriptional regulator [Methylosinus]|uniref:LysR family transcriptional regulator n=1 Tax=Methylosinus trichosporium (strain ATCC 35070 / NCIMB 11131 / UNIQEM 75 / OB3b) TaxID=595536 RepID=A0A2D2D470_METT3|nr:MULTISPECIES: LysR family transcriptional regulator [Methylosinus]ATQ69773.1 LysR family transcriptional regulator [Methylosinus trichosporium OB3b]OBS52428.1 LysR family transcriptional regulator [Methylosinus sp. 3S-1]
MTELRNFDLNLLVAFNFLLEERSVSRAAQKMFISQSAMSHVLQRLRQQLDDPVLVKTPQGMRPTPRALSLVEPIAALLAEVEQVLRSSKEFSPATTQRRFTIATNDYVEFCLLPPLMQVVGLEAPNIEIHLVQTQGSLGQAAEAADVDLVIGFDVILDQAPYLNRERLYTDRIVSLVRRGHPDFSHGEVSLERFIAAKHMLMSRREAGTGLIDDWLEARGLARKVSLVVPNFLSAPWIVANTDLVFSLPLRIAEHFVRIAPLEIVPIPIEFPTYDLLMVWHSLQDKEPAHAWLRRTIVDICRKVAPE